MGIPKSRSAGRIWHYQREGQPYDPVGERQLLALLKAGEISMDTVVKAGGMTEWLPIKDVAALVNPVFPPMPRAGQPLHSYKVVAASVNPNAPRTSKTEDLPGGAGKGWLGFIFIAMMFGACSLCVKPFDEAEFDRTHPKWELRHAAEKLRNMDE